MDRRTGFGTAGTYLAEEKTPARRRLLKTLKTRPLHHSWAGWVCDKIITLVISETHFSPKSVVDAPTHPSIHPSIPSRWHIYIYIYIYILFFVTYHVDILTTDSQCYLILLCEVGNVSCLDLVTTLENKHDCTNVVVVIVYEFRGNELKLLDLVAKKKEPENVAGTVNWV